MEISKATIILTEMRKIIKNFNSEAFVSYFEENKKIIPMDNLHNILKDVCRSGTPEMFSHLMNCDFANKIYFDFPWHESQDPVYDKTIPNGAFLLALESRNTPLLTYFIKNDIYDICSDTEDCINDYFSANCRDYLETIRGYVFFKEEFDKKQPPNITETPKTNKI